MRQSATLYVPAWTPLHSSHGRGSNAWPFFCVMAEFTAPTGRIGRCGIGGGSVFRPLNRRPHQIVFQDYVEAVWAAQDRRDQLEARIAAMLPDWSMAPLVEALRAMRGLDTISAVIFLASIGDLARFETPRHLMAYLGLVPSEQSSGTSVWRGGITKAGSSEARRMLVEAAWSYRYPPRLASEKVLVVERQEKPVREHRPEGAGTLVWALSQAQRDRKEADCCCDRHCARTLWVHLGDRTGSGASAILILPSPRSAGGGAQGQAILENPMGRLNPTPVRSARQAATKSVPAVSNPRMGD